MIASTMKRILVLGSQGMLGTQLLQLCPNAIGWDREDTNVLDFPAFESQVRAVQPRPEAVVNCVAFNDVDGAEDRPDAAFELNAGYVGRLASLCGDLGIPLTHYSTNYVFDGR